MEKAELIWKNGEFVPWDEANVHVLTHGLHYGTGVFEGIRCYDTEIGPAIFRHQDHLDRLAKSAELYYLPLEYDARGDPRGDQGADPPQRAAQLLHPAARVPRLRRDGPLRAERPGRRDRRRLALGRLSRARRASRRASAPRSHPGAGSRLPGSSRTRRHRASTSTRSSPRPRAPTPATTRRSCSTTAASSARAPARTSTSSARARSSLRATRLRSSTGSTASP